MMSTISSSVGVDSAEIALQKRLAKGDATAESIAPVLRHVLTSEDSSLFGDAIVASVKGMLADLTSQLLDRPVLSGGVPEAFRATEPDFHLANVLSDVLLESAALLRHLHALALEWQLIQRLEAQFGVDPVLTPLLQGMIASSNAEVAGLAMQFLASQARHVQAQRKMSLPLLELPPELLHIALTALRAASDRVGQAGHQASAVQSRVRQDYDEGSTRLGLASNLVASLGESSGDALSVRHAGVTLFITSLAIGAGIDRDLAALSTHESQAARLALSLRSCGLNTRAMLDQCLTLHPDIGFPSDLNEFSPNAAAALLAAGAAHLGD